MGTQEHMDSNREAFDTIGTATILRPGDKVLITLEKNQLTKEDAEQMRDLLKEKFPGVDFAILSGAQEVVLLPTDDV